MTTRPPKRLAQLRSVSPALVSILQNVKTDLAVYISEAIGGDHVRRFICD